VKLLATIIRALVYYHRHTHHSQVYSDVAISSDDKCKHSLSKHSPQQQGHIMTELPFISTDTENYLRETITEIEEFLKQTNKEKAKDSQELLSCTLETMSRRLTSDLDTYK